MNYTELKANIQDICENTFTDDQLAMFTQQAEQKIYNSVQIPALRKNVTGTLSNGNQYLGMPSDFLWSYACQYVDMSLCVCDVFMSCMCPISMQQALLFRGKRPFLDS